MQNEESEFTKLASSKVFHNTTTNTVQPFQPNDDTQKRISIVHDYEPGEPGVRLYGNQQATLTVDDVPFSAYWQLKEKKFIFHPMIWGHYVHSNSKNAAFIKRLPELSEKIGSILPNGGLAFFYPNLYPLSRMSGPEFMYSAISQSEALAGYLNAEANFPNAGLKPLTNKVRDALFFEHEYGGVDLGVAQLELPLMHANPEIILNGWLHSLFNLIDYSISRDDEVVARYIERNLVFLMKNQNCWYDETRHISRYSETSPIRIILRPGKDQKQSFATLYKSRVEELPNYAFTPVLDTDKKYSGYDNKITAINPSNGAMTLVTTVSGLYDTIIASDAPFEVKMKDSKYDPTRASPMPFGDWQTIKSNPVGSIHITELASKDFEIFRGYPTNFAKANGKNFYHIQHIVALAYIANTAVLEDQSLKKNLLETASKWYQQTQKFSHKPFEDFESLQTVLDAINRGKLLMQIKNVSELGMG